MVKKFSFPARWEQAHKHLAAVLEHGNGYLDASEGFISLLVKQRDDGTVLSVLKRFGPDGGALVCFGSGYDVAGALLGLDLACQSNAWRVDKPWDKEGG